MNLDLKGDNFQLPIFLMEFLHRHQIETSQIYVSSFNVLFIHQLFTLRQEYQFQFQIGLISCNLYPPAIREQLLSNLDFYVLDYELLNQEIVDYCHQLQISLFVFTNTSQSSYQFISTYSVDGIISNTKYWLSE